MKKRLIMVIGILFLIPTNVFAYELLVEDLVSQNEYVYVSIDKTSDDGIVAVGLSLTSENSVLTRYDSESKLVFQKELIYNFMDTDLFVVPFDVIGTQDGGTIVVGYVNKNSYGRIPTAVFLKYDKDGNIVYQNFRTGMYNETFNFVKEFENGDILIIGNSINVYPSKVGGQGYGLSIITLDKTGVIITEKSGVIASDAMISINDVEVFEDGSFAISGGGMATTIFTNINKEINGTPCGEYQICYSDIEYIDLENNGGTDALFIKFDKDYEIELIKTMGSEKNDFFSSISSINGEDLLLSYSGFDLNCPTQYTCQTSNFSNQILKLDSDGNEVWKTEITNNSSNADCFGLNDENYICFNGINANEEENITSHTELTIIDKDTGKIKNTFNGYDYPVMSLSTQSYATVPSFILDNGDIIFTGVFSLDGSLESNSIDFGLKKLHIKYDININSFDFGSANAMQEGNVGKVEVNPNDGYIVKSITVVDSDNSVVNIETSDKNVYEFKLYDDVQVNVELEKKQTESITNPKTGVEDYLILLGLVLPACGGAYYLINKKKIFRNI